MRKTCSPGSACLRLFPILLLLLMSSQWTAAQDIIWASEVIGVSSEFKYDKYPGQYQAKEALGKPSALPGTGANPCGWNGSSEGNPEGEWIELGFTPAKPASRILIHECFNPGSVSKITLYGKGGESVVAYEQPNPTAADSKGRVMDTKFALTSFGVSKVRIDLKTSAVGGHNQIESVGLTTSGDPVEAFYKINLAQGVTGDFKRETLGTNINTVKPELLPIISPDGKTLYFTVQESPDNRNSAYQEIWKASLQPDGSFSKAVNMGAPLNTGNGNSSLASILPDGNTALVLNTYLPNGEMGIGVSFSKKSGENFGFPTALKIDEFYNRSSYGEYCLVADGRTLLMTLQRDDSEGNKDVYVSFLKEDSTWTAPKNLGKGVNTAVSEISPFLAADGKSLYYATSGRPGYGSADMFLTRRLDDTWTNWSEPQNLGPVLNTPLFDAYYSLTAAGDYVYFSSYQDAIGESDIFRIKLPENVRPEPVVMIQGQVLNAKTNEPLGADVFYESQTKGIKLGSASSNPVTGEFSLILPRGDAYGFLAEARGFASQNENLDLKEVKEFAIVKIDLKLVPLEAGQVLRLNNVFFDTDSYKLRSAANLELNRLAEIMKANQGMKVEIAGHTDNVGSDSYNLNLSDNRARAVLNYLKEKGIGADRLTSKGYGETQPETSNDTPEGRQLNRRVEFRILGM
ncbi:MAG: OmpA family protein [Bacteroidia bacterium]|nr:OmpA family protein [Bacteroidia bacterium]